MIAGVFQEMLTGYATWVKANMLLSAALQFAVLGTLGEIISGWLKAKKFILPFSAGKLPLKMLAWAGMGLFVKYGFTGTVGAVDALFHKGLLPAFLNDAPTGVLRALTISVIMQGFFGPQLMIFHRLEDNLIDWKINFAGIDRALWTLVWFWIPAQMLTFMLPDDYRIGLAALWSLVLGLILGLSTPAKK